MEAAIQTMVTVFVKSSKGKETLGVKDFQNLCKNQLNNIMTDADKPDAVKELLKGLDIDQDGKVGFEEYMKLVGFLATSLSKQRSASNEAPATTNEAPAQSADAPAKAESAPQTQEEKNEVKTEEEQPKAAATAEVEEEKQEEKEEEEQEKDEEEGEEDEEKADTVEEKTS